MGHRPRSPILLSVALSALLVLSACGGAPSPTAAPTKPAAQPTAAPAATTAPAKPAEATKPAAAAQPTTAAQPTAAAPAKPADGQRIRLSLLGIQSPDTQRAISLVLAEYQKTKPNIDLELDMVPFPQLFPKIQASAAAKTPIDIIMADGPNVWNFAYNGIIAPMDDIFDREYVQKSYLPTSQATSTYRGKFYAPPMMESCSLMWYNKSMTDKAGLKPPTELAQSWNMEQALDAWLKTNNPPNVYGVRWGQGTGYQDYEAGLLRRLAGAKDSPAYKGIADDGVTITGYFDHPDAVKGHQFWHDMYQKHKVSPNEAIPDIWFNGKAAFYIGPDNTIGIYNRITENGTKNGFEYSVTGIPYFQGGTQICHTDSWHWALGANSQNKREAGEFIKFISGPVGSKIVYETLRQLPAHAELLNSLPDYQQMPRALVLQQFKAAGQPRIQTPGFTEYNGLAQEFFTNLVTGKDLQVQRLATDVARRADGLMAKYKDWKTK
jgi:ABC-type glycerol-3-phosphate transport system substrate-binding protein